jgi:hypothetical protein
MAHSVRPASLIQKSSFGNSLVNFHGASSPQALAVERNSSPASELRLHPSTIKRLVLRRAALLSTNLPEIFWQIASTIAIPLVIASEVRHA